ncbi:MAG TPA: hypothetical protein DEO70_07725 [Bacteroidales bacterium]|nr:MAG: hypothetical protein A2X11_15605 [Bacteroidetes bacterium GWE2_42_24]OFY29295.1 MAG: hypothetical protein A2X09_06235 [Bacteroidetes bacterium GWF2_43_11]HBZ66711.1 hypothetical protein [Bacteroidales bacterium]
MIQIDDMDIIFREAAGSYKLTPANTAWRRLRRQLLWRKLRYVLGAGVFSAAVVLTFLIAFSDEEGKVVGDSASLHTETILKASAVAGVKTQSEPTAPISIDAEPGINIAGVAQPDRTENSQSHFPKGYGGHVQSARAEESLPVREMLYIGSMNLIPPRLTQPHAFTISPIHSIGIVSENTDTGTLDSIWLWSAEVSGGIRFSQFFAISGGLPGHQTLRDDGTWFMSPSIGADIRVKKNGWYFSAGLAWNRVGQKVQFDVETPDLNPLLSHYNYDTTWVYIYDPPYYGEPFPASIDSTFMAVYNRQMYRGTLAVDYLTIPLMAGYEVKRDGIALSCGAGLAFSFPISWHGEAPNAALNRLVTASEELSHQMDLSLQLRLEASARIASRYWMFFRPVAGLGLLNHLGQQSGLNYRNNSAGIDVGIRIDFNP